MLKRRLTCAVLAAVALGAGAQPAAAETLVPSGTLSDPQGVVRTPPTAGNPQGSLWVADALLGICRVNAQGEVVIDDFCQPEVHAPEIPGVEVPEPVAVNAPGDVADLAFDAASSSFYAAEGGGADGGIWRLTWNPVTDRIVTARKIHTTFGDRVFGLDVHRDSALGPLELDFVSKRSQVVRRIPDAAAITVGELDANVVGTTTAPDVVDVARLGNALYLAEAAGVTVIANPVSSTSLAQPVSALEGQIPGALEADDASGRLYVGTNNAVNVDEVVAFQPSSGLAEPYAGGLAGIGGLGLQADGALLVSDDPNTAAGVVGAEGGGRVHRFAKVPLGRSTVGLTAAPSPVTAAPIATFAYAASSSGASFECRLDSPAWTPCPGTGSGTVTFGDATPLADGPHEFAVRAIDGSGPGQTLRHAFTVDTVRPTVTVDNGPEDRVVEGPDLELLFSASESASFTCAVDGAAPVSCDAPLRLRGLSLGRHEVVVSATDLAGHTSDPADAAGTWAFEVVPAPVRQDNSGPGSSNSGSGSGDDDSGPRAEVLQPFTETSRRTSCRGSVSTKLDLRRKPAAVSVVFPADLRPRRVRMVIGKLVGKRVKTVVGMDRAIEGRPTCANVVWGLWKDEGRRLRKGKYVLTVVAGSSRRTMKHIYRGPLRVIR